MSKHKPQLYYALTDFDLSFKPKEFDWIVKRWNENATLSEIHREVARMDFERRIDEVALLLYDLIHHKLIKAREGGIFGNGI